MTFEHFLVLQKASITTHTNSDETAERLTQSLYFTFSHVLSACWLVCREISYVKLAFEKANLYNILLGFDYSQKAKTSKLFILGPRSNSTIESLRKRANYINLPRGLTLLPNKHYCGLARSTSLNLQKFITYLPTILNS